MDRNKVFKVSGEIINDIRYTDNTADERGLEISMRKTKWMVVETIDVGQNQLLLNGQLLKRVNHFSWINGRIMSRK